MECLQFPTDIADLDDVMYSVDLASGYYQVDMDSNSVNTLDFIGEASITSSKFSHLVYLLPPGASARPCVLWLVTSVLG